MSALHVAAVVLGAFAASTGLGLLFGAIIRRNPPREP